MKVSNCRLCDGSNFQLIISLGNSALANEFVDYPIVQNTYPLDLFRCNDCGHFQLLEVVDPEIMFKNYLYTSGTSKLMRDHFAEYATSMVNDLKLNSSHMVCDIGSNDSTLLKEFAKHNLKVMGVEPASNLAKKSNSEGITTICDFFNIEIAKNIVQKYGKAELITSNNCFAHLHDLKGFVLGVKELLTDNGVFVFENAYLLDMLKTNDFSQIYHEHLSYHSIKSLNTFFNKLGMKIFKVDFINIHGGSIRVYVTKDTSIRFVNEYKILQLIKNEESTHIYEDVDWADEDFVYNNNETKIKLKNRLLELKSQGKTIAGVLASAKSTTILHYFDIGNDILDFIADDASEKIGKLSPGKHIPILPFTAIYEKKPDYLLMLSYNFIDFIREKHKDYKGIWIVPFPQLKEI